MSLGQPNFEPLREIMYLRTRVPDENISEYNQEIQQSRCTAVQKHQNITKNSLFKYTENFTTKKKTTKKKTKIFR